MKNFKTIIFKMYAKIGFMRKNINGLSNRRIFVLGHTHRPLMDRILEK